MESTRKYLPIAAILLVAVIALLYFLFQRDDRTEPSDRDPVVVTSFEECASLGYPIMESYPEQCRTPDGQTFTRDIESELETSDLIRVSTPRPGEKVSSPLSITGEARGSWYFEASFPVEIVDTNGVRLGGSSATTKENWMTNDFVPFEATITFQVPTSTTEGILILHKDNPSGLPENESSLRIPIVF